MFNKLYLGEIKKLIRPKTLIILSIIMVLFLLLYAIGYEFLVDFDVNIEIESEDEDLGLFTNFRYAKRKYTEEQMDALLSAANEYLKSAQESVNKSRLFYMTGIDPVYEAKGYIKALEYIKKNKLYNEEITIYSNLNLFSDKSAEGFMKGSFSILLTIMMMYAVVVGAGSYAHEMRTGTLKMMFMRPITKNKLTTAKLLAALTMVTALLLGITGISYLYGLVRFGPDSGQKIVVVFNASKAFVANNGLLLFMNIMFGLLQACAMCVFAFALGTITRNRIFALSMGIVLNLGILSSILSLLGIGRFLFTTNANLGIYFGITSSIPMGGNFFLALSLLLAYLAVMLAGTYIVFNKKDIA